MNEEHFLEAKHWANRFLEQSGLPPAALLAITILIDLIILFTLSWLADLIARKIILSVVTRFVRKTKVQWDDYLLEGKFFQGLAHLAPVIIIKQTLPYVFDDFPNFLPLLDKLTSLYALVIVILIFARLFKSLERYFLDQNKFEGKPIGTVFQVLIVLNIFFGIIIAISIITNTNPGTLLGAFAGTTAILILVFQDTINGVLANLQISMYDLIKIGDWITFDKFGADGDVVSIDLTTVKIQNFDKTISTVPTRAFVNDSFVNWRGMAAYKARRIKRNIVIDINSIKHMDDALLDRLSKVHLIKDYLFDKQQTITQENQKTGVDLSIPINGRRQTNIGAFRAYVTEYLKAHPDISKSATTMVRQLQPNQFGVPVEVYCFSNTTIWLEYERSQSDIFAHLYAASAYFDLILYQSPSGKDIRSLTQNFENQV